MTFDDILDQAIALLQRRGRVTYRTLKWQFDLDDDVLEDLKEELIYGQRLALDEGSRVLVWAGGAIPPESNASPPPSQEGPHTAPPVASRPGDAERRQLTVLFCDLVDSTALASQLDPEAWREVVRAYQDTWAKVIARFEGHIAQYLGDGLLVYFGYPLAHEDDAQRAVRAGLGILKAMAQLNTRLAQERGVSLAVRLGIHTGLVVVGDRRGGGRGEVAPSLRVHPFPPDARVVGPRKRLGVVWQGDAVLPGHRRAQALQPRGGARRHAHHPRQGNRAGIDARPSPPGHGPGAAVAL